MMKTDPVINQFDGSYVTSRVNESDDTIDVTGENAYADAWDISLYG